MKRGVSLIWNSSSQLNQQLVTNFFYASSPWKTYEFLMCVSREDGIFQKLRLFFSFSFIRSLFRKWLWMWICDDHELACTLLFGDVIWSKETMMENLCHVWFHFMRNHTKYIIWSDGVQRNNEHQMNDCFRKGNVYKYHLLCLGHF